MGPSAKAKAKSKAKAKASAKKGGTKKATGTPVFPNEEEEIVAAEVEARRKFIEHPDAVDDLRSVWRTWLREHQEWSQNMISFGEPTLLSSMLRHLTAEQKSVVFAAMPLGTMTLAGIIATLRDEYGADTMIQERQDSLSYEAHVRTNESLRDFMRKHALLRNQAIGSGMADDNLGGGFRLLKAAALEQSQESAILRTCKLRAELSGMADGKPTYAQIAAELRTMVQVDELDVSAAATKQEKVMFVRRGAGGIQKPGGPADKKKKKKQKQQQKAASMVKALAALGVHDSNQLVAFTQGGGGKGGGGGGYGGGGKGYSVFGKGDTQAAPFDWLCPACGKTVFASKAECFSCSTPRPQNPTRSDALKGAKGKGKGAKGKPPGGAGAGAGAAANPA